MTTFLIKAQTLHLLQDMQRLTSLLSRKQIAVIEIHATQSTPPSAFLLSIKIQAHKKEAEWLKKQLANLVDLSDLSLEI